MLFSLIIIKIENGSRKRMSKKFTLKAASTTLTVKRNIVIVEEICAIPAPSWDWVWLCVWLWLSYRCFVYEYYDNAYCVLNKCWMKNAKLYAPLSHHHHFPALSQWHPISSAWLHREVEILIWFSASYAAAAMTSIWSLEATIHPNVLISSLSSNLSSWMHRLHRRCNRARRRFGHSLKPSKLVHIFLIEWDTFNFTRADLSIVCNFSPMRLLSLNLKAALRSLINNWSCCLISITSV